MLFPTIRVAICFAGWCRQLAAHARAVTAEHLIHDGADLVVLLLWDAFAPRWHLTG